jgi:hypothetical protein
MTGSVDRREILQGAAALAAAGGVEPGASSGAHTVGR